MKTTNILTKNLIILFLLFVSSTIFSQENPVDVNLTDMEYDSTPVMDCGTIDFGSNDHYYLNFTLEMYRDHDENDQVYDSYGESGTVYIELYSNGTLVHSEPYSIEQDDWFIDYTDRHKVSMPISFLVWSSDIDTDNNELKAKYATEMTHYYTQCNYTITKPVFSLSPENVAIPCQDTSQRTFSVENIHNSPGFLQFQWEVGTGWSRTGTFTTTSNSITLTPNAFPPDNVSVTPILDGVSFPTLTSIVGLAPFNPTNNSIVGVSTACSSTSNVYTVSNLSNNINVNSWSLENADPNNHNVIATLSNNTGNSTSINVAANGNGTVILKVTLINSCGQISPPITKQVYVGNPQKATKIIGPTSIHPDVIVNYQVPPIEGATSYEWRVPYPYTTVNNFTNSRLWQLDASTSHSSYITAYTGTEGRAGLVQVWGKNVCGSGPVKYISVSQNQGGGNGRGEIIRRMDNFDNDNQDINVLVYPNPTKDKIEITLENYFLNATYKIKIFDLNNRLMKVVERKGNKSTINVKELPKGLYILKIYYGDKIINQKIMIEK